MAADPLEDGVELEGVESDPDQLSEYLMSLLTDENADLPLVYLPEKRTRYYRCPIEQSYMGFYNTYLFFKQSLV